MDRNRFDDEFEDSALETHFFHFAEEVRVVPAGDESQAVNVDCLVGAERIEETSDEHGGQVQTRMRSLTFSVAECNALRLIDEPTLRDRVHARGVEWAADSIERRTALLVSIRCVRMSVLEATRPNFRD